MTVEADTREEAVQKMKDIMTEEAIAQHQREKHPGEPILPQAQVHAMIEQNLVAV